MALSGMACVGMHLCMYLKYILYEKEVCAGWRGEGIIVIVIVPNTACTPTVLGI